MVGGGAQVGEALSAAIPALEASGVETPRLDAEVMLSGITGIDRALVDWGMPMGPLRLADEVGLDVSAKVGHILHDAFPDRLLFPAWIDRIAEDRSRLGTKSGKGIYLYKDGRELEADPAVYAILQLTPPAGLGPPPAEPPTVRSGSPPCRPGRRCPAWPRTTTLRSSSTAS